TLDALPRAATSQHNRFQPIIEKLAAGAGGTPKLFATKRGVKLNYQTRFRMTSTEPASAIIPARSRGQAMDWSLVLLSQGIECMIEHREEGWALLVGPQDFERAVAALRQYEIENPGWRCWPLTWPERAGISPEPCCICKSPVLARREWSWAGSACSRSSRSHSGTRTRPPGHTSPAEF